MATEIIVVTDEEGRIDAFIASRLSLSRSFAAELIDDDKVLLNGSAVKKRALVKSGDEVTVEIPELKEPEALPQDIPIDSGFLPPTSLSAKAISLSIISLGSTFKSVGIFSFAVIVISP